MRVLRMHNNADEQFDQFVKKQLEQTEVDPVLAQHYFDQLQLPQPSAGGAATTVAKGSWWRFCVNMVVVSAAAVVIYEVTRPSAEPPAATVSLPAVSLPNLGRQQPVTSSSNAAGVPKAALPKPIVAPPANATSPLLLPRATTVPLPAAEIPAPVTVLNTKRKDSLPRQLSPASAMPKKTNDSLYIIW
jgi:hypothetical protein